MANIEIPENIILDLTRDEKIQLIQSHFPARRKVRVGESLRLESLTTQFGKIKIQ